MKEGVPLGRTVLQVNTAVLVFQALVFQVLLGAVPAYAFLPAGLLLCQSPRFDPLLQKTFPQCFLHRPSYRGAFCIHRCSTSFRPPETLLTIPSSCRTCTNSSLSARRSK